MPCRTICLLLLTLALSGAPRADRLPIRQFGIVDGLATDAVSAVYRDSRGFLWFSTHSGLSRFDGHGFSNYGAEHGLPVDVLVDFAEDPSGVYWVATWGGGGISRFDPRGDDPARLLRPVRLGDGSSERSTTLLADRSGRIWVGTVAGLYVGDSAAGVETRFDLVDLATLPGIEGLPRIRHLVEDPGGGVWIALPSTIVRHTPAGQLHAYPITPPGIDRLNVQALMVDREGRLWISHTRGVIVLRAPAKPPGESPGVPSCATGRADPAIRLPEHPGESCALSLEELPGPGEPRGMFQSSDGHVWIVRYTEGLTEFNGSSLHTHGESDGVGGYLVDEMTEDPAGNLWLATLDSGALRIARTGFTAYDRADGLGYTRRARLTESLKGEVSVVAGPQVYRFDGERFESIRPGVLEGLGHASSDMSAVLQDRAGAWWFGTRRGLYRYGRAESIRQLASREPEEAVTGEAVLCLFEDSSGDLWIGVDDSAPVLRWKRSTGELHRYSGDEGLSSTGRPFSIAEDASGQIWVGFLRGVARFRDGRFTHFTKKDGFTADGVIRPFVDRSGRLWLVSGYSGVTRVDDPAAERPSFSRRYTVADGLATNPVICAVDDRFGRIYFCTPKGIDRLDPETDRIRHFTTADGLSTSEIAHGMRDRSGTLWFTSMRGVSRLVPRPDPSDPQPPPVWVTGLKVAGVPVPLSELGERRVSDLVLRADENRLQIEFASLSFEVGEQIRYRYRLGGAEEAWSAATTVQSINFANMSPGRYRFEVRALNAHGVESESPAVVDLRVLPPLWRRWWVLSLGVVALAGIVVGVHRLRLARLLELERVRTRIATDLHDDIGASLSQIAILTEVLHRREDLESSTSRTYLSRIADSSRELVDSMADIVWAINPRRDRLSDLVQRMRRFMGDAVAGREIEYRFVGPSPEKDLALGPDLRRELFLVFKESVNNAVRHSGCARVGVELELDGSVIRLEIGDDGDGFDPSREYEGNGLDSIRRRARGIGGRLELDSRPGEGTTVRLEVRLQHRRRSTGTPPSPE